MRRLAVLVLALTACSSSTPVAAPVVVTDTTATTEPAVAPADPSVPTADGAASTTIDDPPAVTPSGFDRVRARVTEADGRVCELCLWLADDGDRRARGLMFVTDLDGADGMAFRYPAPHSGNFWMKNTVLPLSIAFFDADGAYLDAFDMEPCTDDPCPRYATPRQFLVAVETRQGELADIGMVAGSTLELLNTPCDPS